MTITAALLSIVLITLVAYLAHKTKVLKNVCPICAGVFLTWSWMLMAYFQNIAFDPTVIAMLMGGSVVGTAYALEKKPDKKYTGLLFKSMFIPAGFLTAYAIINQEWVLFTSSLLVLVSIYTIFGFQAGQEHAERIKVIKDKMGDCC